MKNELHPKSSPVIFHDTTCDKKFYSTSTLTSDETEDVDGVSHFVIPIEISSGSHPFFTGKQILVDTARRVEKFQSRQAKQDAAAASRKGKKEKRQEARAKKEAEKAKEEK